MNDFLIKLLVLLATSYWWFPVMRIVVEQAWRVTNPEAQDATDTYRLPAAVERASQGWNAKDASRRNPSNSSWSIGRRPVLRREQSFINKSKSSASLTSFGSRAQG